jgi:hypothetical protein
VIAAACSEHLTIGDAIGIAAVCVLSAVIAWKAL